MAFWAKTTREGKPGISVSQHMANVGHVARCLAEIAPDLLNRFQIRAAEAGALAALHDLGKISPGFQQKCEAWLKENHLDQTAQRWAWDTAMEPDHGKVTHAAVQDFLLKNGTSHRTAKFLSVVLGGHHGRFNPPHDRGFKPSKQISEQHSGVDWDMERNAAATAICHAFRANLAGVAAHDENPALWWLAGLTSVADWIGSDENFFPAESGAVATDAGTTAPCAISTFVRRIAPATVGSRIIHGNSWLLEQEFAISPAASGRQDAASDARIGRDWFASAKRALLAPRGVGTVEQALLGVVAAKHFFVRHFALAGKVVILDEIHSHRRYG